MEALKRLKTVIDQGDLDQFKEELICVSSELSNLSIDSSFLFQKLYLHSCLKKKYKIASYLEKDIYPLLPEIEKISIRQCFPYGKYLLKK